MRVTQDHRDKALKLLMTNLMNQRNKMIEDLKKDIEKDYSKSLPKTIINSFYENKSFFKLFDFFDSYSAAHVQLNLPMPINTKSYNFDSDFLSKETKSKILSLRDFDKNYRDLKNKTEGYLSKITRSTKMVELFPETDSIFVIGEKNLLPSIPLDELRNSLLLVK